MGSPISVAMADIFMNKLERDVIKPPLPIFYKWYVDNIYVRRKRNIDDKLFNDLNNYHENIKFTVGNAPKKFLDTPNIVRKQYCKYRSCSLMSSNSQYTAVRKYPKGTYGI